MTVLAKHVALCESVVLDGKFLLVYDRGNTIGCI